MHSYSNSVLLNAFLLQWRIAKWSFIKTVNNLQNFVTRTFANGLSLPTNTENILTNFTKTINFYQMQKNECFVIQMFLQIF